MTLVRQRIDVSLPRKHKSLSASTHEKQLAKFHAQVYSAVLKLLALPALRMIILASPGFTKDAVYNYLFEEATRQGEKLLMGNEVKRRFLKVACNSPHVHSLMEVLRSPEVHAQLKDTKFAREGQLLDKFQRTLATDELRAWYGEAHVFLAAARGAIGSLLISDGLFRAADPARRKRFVKLVEEVRQAGGEAAIFSGLHESGKTLNGLTGIAAILRFPLDVEVAEEEERLEQEQERKKKENQLLDEGAPLVANPNR
jgi:protein pelota